MLSSEPVRLPAGLTFGREGEHEEDRARKLEYFALFDRCFFAVRGDHAGAAPAAHAGAQGDGLAETR